MEKMTNVKALNFVIGMDGIPEDVKAKLVTMRDGFVKKSSAERKPTANQAENVGFKNAILNTLEVGKKYTVTDIQKTVPELADVSGQRVSAIVTQLKNDGLLIRTEDKRKAYFHIPVEVEE